jgi:hypothetical protein
VSLHAIAACLGTGVKTQQKFKMRASVAYEARVASTAAVITSWAGKLAQFFPEATPVRIPVRVTGIDSAGEVCSEETVIEFGTPREVIFSSRLPLEFATQLRVENSDGSLRTEACVVALQLHDGHMAVAARFVQEPLNWIVKSSQ